jgi:tetratricopeptide (TPR) repeat protein
MTRISAAMWMALLVAACPPPTRAEASNFEQGLASYQAGDCAAALQSFSRSERAGENAPDRPLYEGICLAAQSQWTLAEGPLAKYVNSRPSDPRGWRWLAQERLHARRFAGANEAIQRSLDLDRGSADAWRILGEIDLEQSDYNGAYRAWLEADKLKPSDARTTYYLGRLFFEADFLNEAAGWFRETLKSDPRHFAAMTYLGMCAERLNMQKTALELYQAAIRESRRQNEPFSWAFVADARLLRDLGREQEALAALEEAERTCPDAHVLTLLGEMLASSAPDRAEAELRRAISMDASIPEAHYRLALLLRMKRKDAEAESEMQKFRQAKEAEERNKSRIQAIRRAG